MPEKKRKDTLFSQPLNTVSPFVFDQSVTDVFDDMINRSVPSYSDVIKMTGLIAAIFARKNTTCYDLGCSLGANSLSMSHHIKEPSCHIVAIDNSSEMIERCQQLFTQAGQTERIQLICDDVMNVNYENASVIVCNYTLQFIEPTKREGFLKNIHAGLNDGGVFIYSDKIKINAADEDKLLTELHHQFKRSQGYSNLEISQKRTALENILIPDSIETHTKRLKKLGYSNITCWHKSLNFASFLAVK